MADAKINQPLGIGRPVVGVFLVMGEEEARVGSVVDISGKKPIYQQHKGLM